VTDGRTDRQNYDLQDRASIAALSGKKSILFYFIAGLVSCATKLNKLNTTTILKALAGLSQHTPILFCFMANETISAIK